MKPKKKHILLSLFFVVQLLFLQWIENNPDFVETYYSNGIYPSISIALRMLYGWLPFSFGDLLVFYGLYKILQFIYHLFKTRFKYFWYKFFRAIAFISSLYFFFYLLWGFNYYRNPLSENLGLKEEKYSTEELDSLSHFLIDELNSAHFNITQSDSLKVENPYNPKEMYTLAKESYKELANDYPEFTYKYRSVKSSLMSLVQTYNGTSGYFNPLSGEAQVNKRIPKTSFPTTACHEISHQLGYAAENEANFIGFLAASYSDDKYFQYAAYRMATRYVIFELYKRDPELYKMAFQKLNSGVIKDFRASSDFWSQYENPFEPIVKKGYNAYLKANKQSKGVDSYNYVVNLFVSYNKQKGNI